MHSDSTERVLPSDQGSLAPASSNSLNDLEHGVGNDIRNEKVEEKSAISWDGPGDPDNPHNWSTRKKFTVTILYSMMNFCMTFSSSVFSTATESTVREFRVSPEVMTLGTSLFILGFSIGPIIWGPMSELYGRMIPIYIGLIACMIFQIPTAVAQNVETIMLSRFFGGLFGSSSIVVTAGALSDFWGPVDRGLALGIYAGTTFIGPTMAPVIGGFITQSYLGWRWTAWITMILIGFIGILGVFFCSESYAPLLLQRRAAKKRFETRDWAIHAALDEEPVRLHDITHRYLLRPFKMLVLEPVLFLITLYISLIYGTIYLFFEAYPIAFQEDRHWNLGVGALPFLGIQIGVVIGVAFIVWNTNTRYKRKMLENGGIPVPEERLIPMMVGAVILPIGLFWFAWTSNPHITWVPQVLAGIPIGCGILLIFLQGLSYIIDLYLQFANSAIAINTFVRSLAGAGFPLFAAPMYHNLGVPWATSLLAFLTIAFLPAPFLFYIYGERLRQMSKFSPHKGKK